jgi:glycerol-3-phosphate cytidylyltransferase
MKVVITFSAFNLCHSGHVKMLKEAKRQCDYLIVGLQLDPSMDRPEKNGPSQSIIERYIQLKGFKYLDELYRMYQIKI